MYRIRFGVTTTPGKLSSRCGSLFKLPLRIIPNRKTNNEADGLHGHSFVDVTAEELGLLCEALPLLSYLLKLQDSTTKRQKRVGATDKHVAELHLDPGLGVSKVQFQKLMTRICLTEVDTASDSGVEEIRDTATKLGGCRLFRSNDNSESYQPFVDDRSNEDNWSLVGKLSLDMSTIPENGVV